MFLEFSNRLDSSNFRIASNRANINKNLNTHCHEDRVNLLQFRLSTGSFRLYGKISKTRMTRKINLLLSTCYIQFEFFK